MARAILLISALAILCIGADAPPDPNAAFAQSLAVQMALKQGRDAMQKGDAKAAVEFLEPHVGKCNGNTDYLTALRDAYAMYVKDLQLKRQDDLCQVYHERLKILDRNANLDAKPVPPLRTPEPVAKPTPAEPDPLQQTPKRTTAAINTVAAVAPVNTALVDAEKAFGERRYAEADKLFAKAFAAGSEVPPRHGAQWAYCKFAGVVARLQASDGPPGDESEAELATAIKLAGSDAKLDTFGKQLTEELQRRKGATTPAPVVDVRHSAKGDDGWARAQSANFQLRHGQPREYAEQVLRAAEQARAAGFAKWGGDAKTAWKTPCDVYVHTSAEEYAKATGKPATGPGHATFQMKSGIVEKRRLDLRADEPNTITNVIPHETTHLVLADLFDAPLPRWADEGMAVLAEPRGQVDRYLKALHRCRGERKLVPLAQVMQQVEYPDAAAITVFYVESVSLVDFLIEEKGPETLVAFLKDVLKGAKTDAAVQQHFGFRGAKELQDRWLVKNFQ